MCREMAELGLDVARHAAAAARQEWQPPANPPQPETPAAATPAARPTRATASDSPRAQAPSPSLAVTRLIHAVRCVIALETTISARLQAATERAEQIARDRAYRQAEAASTRPATQPTPAPARTSTPPGISSLLAKVSQEIGVDLEHPNLPVRHLPEPTGPPR